MKTQEIIRIRRSIQDLPIITLYLFGSRARKDRGPLSDYDFAVQTRTRLSPRERFALKLALHDRFSRALHTDQVDVVILEDAPPLLAHRILKEGQILYCADAKMRVRSEFQHLTMYLDFRDD